MTSATQNQINRLTKEIANLKINDAREASKEAGLIAKINRSNEVAFRTKSNLTYRSKVREVERASKDLANVKMKRAKISKSISDKTKNLALYEERQLKEKRREIKRQSDLEKRSRREQEQHIRKIVREVRPHTEIQSMESETYPEVSSQTNSYDFFISHASEDKDRFVRGLVKALEAKGAKVWFDEFALKVGDSLRQKIDQGLYESRFGIVVISRNFINKEWPKKELDGLVSLEIGGQSRILPIWHEISKDEVIKYSPTLADKIALNTSKKSTQEIASQLIQFIGGED